ncbi:hypothetical protein FHG87_024398, partial [Trinorchestia longiramus]
MPSGSPGVCDGPTGTTTDCSTLRPLDDGRNSADILGSDGNYTVQDMRVLATQDDNTGSVTPTLDLHCSYGSMGSLDSGHSSEVGMGQSASTPDSGTPPPLLRHSPSRQGPIIVSSSEDRSTTSLLGTPPIPENKINGSPPNLCEGSFGNTVPAAAEVSAATTPVPNEASSDEEGGPAYNGRDLLRRSSSRDSGRPVTVTRSDSMGSNTSRKSNTSTLSAMSAVSAVSSYSTATDFSNLSSLSRGSDASFASTLSRKSGLSSLTASSKSSHVSGVSHLSDISGLSASTASSSGTIKPRKTKEELDASIEQLESLWSAEDDWIMIFDRLINNSLSSRPRRHTHATSTHFAPYRSPHRRSMRITNSRSVSLQSSPCH